MENPTGTSLTYNALYQPRMTFGLDLTSLFHTRQRQQKRCEKKVCCQTTGTVY
jgi:hypothetical protein